MSPDEDKICEVCHKGIIENLYTMTRTGYRHIGCPPLEKMKPTIKLCKNCQKPIEVPDYVVLIQGYSHISCFMEQLIEEYLKKHNQLTFEDVILISVEATMNEMLEQQGCSSSYREIANAAAISAATYAHRVRAGLHNYEKPTFEFDQDNPEDFEDNPIPDLDAILKGQEPS